MYKQFFLVVLCVVGLVVVGCSNSGCIEGVFVGGGDNVLVCISVGFYNFNNLLFFIVDVKGYFKDVGLQVKIENFVQGGFKVLQVLVVNFIDVVVGFYDYIIQMQVKGKDVVVFVLFLCNFGLVMVGCEDVIFDLVCLEIIKGQKVGIIVLGFLFDFFVCYFFVQYDILVDSILLIGVGLGVVVVVVLEQGKIDLLVNYDFVVILIIECKVGRIIFDVCSDDGVCQVYGGLYLILVMYVNQSFFDK